MRLLVAAALAFASVCAFAADTLPIRTPGFEGAITQGALTSLKADGQMLIAPLAPVKLTGILRTEKDHFVADGKGDPGPVAAGKPVNRVYDDLSDLPGSSLTNTYAVDGSDFIVTQRGVSPLPGVHGVQWGLGLAPLEYNIIVPGNGGIRIRKDSPGTSFQFDYPLSWEAQLVIIEGPGFGFCVWAEDAAGRYKRLIVNKEKQGWQLAFVTHNNAPFAPLKDCASVRWHVSPYKGDWRVPARRYRDWAAANWKPTPKAAQTPAWAKDIRFLAMVGEETTTLEALAKRVDPKQTLLYVPGWRKFEYDRMYPDYTANDAFPQFVEKAHELGFHIMVHCNYFGCDPKSPEYATYEKYQVRNPWTHEREWWLWDRVDPIIKFAYINPACKAWRQLQISRWKELVEKYKVDAMHLDQTLCIYNDDNGLIDGMTMLEGNIALQRELHETLPDVALSGEGLDEVTMRYEAFAQRHSYGLDFIGGTWDRAQLAMAHPISSYLINSYTQPYGYLGMCSPTNGQLYAAWRQNYMHWGVIPTFGWPDPAVLAKPEGFAAQCLDEAACFTQHRLDPDFDGPWPADVCFPYKGANGVRAVYRENASASMLALDEAGKTTEVSRTITGVAEITLPGSIPGWKCYDDKRLFGLDSDVWYAYSTEPRDQKAFHVYSLPSGFTVSRATKTDQMAVIEVKDTGSVIRLTHLFDQATCGSQGFDDGQLHEVHGALAGGEDGALFQPQGLDIFAHPPWRALRKNPQTGVTEANGTGIAFASFPLELPDVQGSVWFRCDVAMDKGAVGKTDGVLYSVTATVPGCADIHAELLNATATNQPLAIDLTPMRGKKVTLRLQVDPGPTRNPSFDWARWYGPRVEIERRQTGSVGVAGFGQLPYPLCAEGPVSSVATGAGSASFNLQLPGSLILLREAPKPVALPLDLAKSPFLVTFLSENGQTLTNPQYASAVPESSTVGGVTRAGLFAHPPDHGTTNIDIPMTLPAGPVRFHAFIGLRDGSKSDGCGFIVKVSGKRVAYQHKLPGEWTEMSADLSAWAGKPIVLSLVTDSEGPFSFDWAQWGEPMVTAGG
jgi:hypothetical protein